jgi:hypothetical protein
MEVLDFLIGEKVKWSIGGSGKDLISKGLFIEFVDQDYSLVNVYEIHNQPTRRQIKVLTNLLQRDD